MFIYFLFLYVMYEKLNKGHILHISGNREGFIGEYSHSEGQR